MPAAPRSSLAASTAALLCLLSPAASRAAATQSFPVLRGTARTSPVDVASARLVQDGPAIRLRIELVAGRAAAAPGSSVCARFSGRHATKLCFRRVRRHWVVSSGGHVLSRPEAAGHRSLAASVPLARLGLRPGRTHWSVTEREPACADPGCEVRLPAAGPGAPVRILRPVATGCTNPGGRQVTQGPAGKRIALTFDDGPSPFTGRIRAILRRERVPATFFVIGRQVASRAAELRGELAEGDELANHSWSHANLGGGGPAATSEMERTNAAIHAATGFTPCLFRPPYGATGGDLVARAGALGMTTTLWSVDPQDWATPGTGTIVGRILGQTRAGAIILDHDGGGPRDQTVAAVPTAIRSLRREGYRFVTVSQLIGQHTTWDLRP